MKILVIGGMHGNERLGIAVVGLLQKRPIEDVDTVIASPRAVERNRRFIDEDLNRSFGLRSSSTYESSRAKILLKQASRYDLVLDFHNTQTPANNCSFVGLNAEKLTKNASMSLGLSRCIEASYDCINNYAPNALSIEISEDDSLNTADYWRIRIEQLQANDISDQQPTMYQFSRRVTWEEKYALSMDDWQPFQEISEYECQLMKLPSCSAPIFVGSTLTEYYATIVTKL